MSEQKIRKFIFIHMLTLSVHLNISLSLTLTHSFSISCNFEAVSFQIHTRKISPLNIATIRADMSSVTLNDKIQDVKSWNSYPNSRLTLAVTFYVWNVLSVYLYLRLCTKPTEFKGFLNLRDPWASTTLKALQYTGTNMDKYIVYSKPVLEMHTLL